ncbi:cytochrome c1 [Thiococcus pfennigii]|jgi:ubiquinol-cytochrome c reductase cytochrome c1 subunit|uniref:cytochrome c1 n=1 Tax=Thiococcus pfennigii TaxID=1057 RepID=UPI001908C47C|nr:cytochrome c1 [Thiococcus pfennigii]MBK1701603.1 cytochrome c1 [Thiococcus pfennigii]
MSKPIAALILLLSPMLAFGAGGGGVHLEKAKVDLDDKESLQRGAQYYVDRCLGCHSLQYHRYNRMAEDLGIDEADLRADFIYGNGRPGDLIENAMRPEDGEKWFGTAVPDLTLVTRWRSPDWVYTYLKSFYLDPSRPYGVNNLVFKDVGMPHVLGGLQGLQKAVYEEKGHGDEAHQVIEGVELVEPGTLSPQEYDQMARDLTAFLTYIGDPVMQERRDLGVKVLLFLGVLFVFAYALKKEYWKDVH